MERHLLQFLFLLCGLGALNCGLAQSTRLAISGDPSLANLIAITESELSRQQEFTILDRADLNKLGREKELQAALASSTLQGIQLLPADGLILLQSASQDGKKGVFARLVAVQPGLVLREITLPEGPDPVEQAKAIEREFAPYWPKLEALQKDKATKLSLLGLRCEVDAPGARELERRVNLLLASRLSVEPSAVVLERWRLHDALFEKSIAREEPTPFWAGSSLIDGSLRLIDGQVEATLRVRPAQGKEMTVSDRDTPENLPLLVDRLAKKILDQPADHADWKRDVEAGHYARLGKWGLDNRLYDQGLQAIETALALGDTSRTTRMLQVKAYAMRAYPDDMRVFNSPYQNQLIKIAPESIPERLDAATQAAVLMQEYLKDYRDFSSLRNPEDPVSLSLGVLNNCLRALRAGYENGFHQNDSARVAETRHAAQKLIATMDGPVKANTSFMRHYFQVYQIRYASLWHENPEDTLAFYRSILAEKSEEGDIREELFRSLQKPYLDGEGTLVHISALEMTGSPWLVSWDGQSEEALQAIWRKFVEGYASESDPVQQADALKFAFFSDHTIEAQDQTAARAVTLLKQHPDVIWSSRGTAFITGFMRSFSAIAGRPVNAAPLGDLVELYRHSFTQQTLLPTNWVVDFTVIPKAQTPSTEALKNLLTALESYAQWYQAQGPPEYHQSEAIAGARQTIYRARPELVPAAPALDVLSVHQLWIGQDLSQPNSSPKLQANARTVQVFDDQIWFLTANYPHQVICLDPASLQVVRTFPIPDQFDPRHLGPTPPQQALAVTDHWLSVALAGQVLVCSRSDQQWRALDVPPSNYQPAWVKQELYLLYDTARGDRLSLKNVNDTSSVGSGLIHVSLPDGKPDNLISSRRIPPQSALDGKPLGQPLALWAGPAGLTMAVNGENSDFQVYASTFAKNDWQSVTANPNYCHIKLTPEGAVVGHRFTYQTFEQITLMNDQGITVLLANPDGAAAKEKPLWPFPADLRKAPAGQRSYLSPMMRQGDFCFVQSNLNNSGENETACLYYFTKGGGEGLKIPLSFEPGTMANPGLAKSVKRPDFDFQALSSTSYGLVISGHPALWVIPWRELDAYRAKAASAAKPNSGK